VQAGADGGIPSRRVSPAAETDDRCCGRDGSRKIANRFGSNAEVEGVLQKSQAQKVIDGQRIIAGNNEAILISAKALLAAVAIPLNETSLVRE
jgi:hypothetical protein